MLQSRMSRGLWARNALSFNSWHGNKALLVRLLQENFFVGEKYRPSMLFGVCTVIGHIRICDTWNNIADTNVDANANIIAIEI